MPLKTTLLKMPTAAPLMASLSDKFWAVVLIAVVMGLFSLSDDHRFGLVFLREAIIGLALLATAYVLMQKMHEMDTADWYLLILAGMLFLIPPVFAYMHYHQPLQFGLLEERRSLLYLTYFLLMIAMVGRKGFGEADVERILKYLFYLALAWSVANAFEWIPRHSGFSFSVRDEQFAEGFVATDERFATRFLEGGFLILLYPFYLAARGQWLKLGLPLVLLALYMGFINQTRSLAMAIVLVLLLLPLMRQRIDRINISALMVIPALVVLGYFAYFLYVYAFNEPAFFYDYHRNREMRALLGSTLQDFFIPHGGLSLQFNEGLRSIYGFNVYTSDVGLIGLLFKYGVLFLPLSFFMLLLAYFLYAKYKNDFSIILLAWLIASFIMIPFGDTLGRGTEIIALLAALTRLQGANHEHHYIACVRRGRSP